MKIRLFNRGKGWYISCTNYQDKTDKAYINVHFTKDAGEPEARLNADGYAQIDIDAQEVGFGCKNKYPRITVFKYELLTGEDLSKFGGRTQYQNIIQPGDLPFDEETPW